jgi:ABC-type transport system involved in cytochrome c biogenesis permease component
MTYGIRFSFDIYKFLGKSVFALKVNLYEKPFMIIMIIFPIIITVVSFGLFISEQYKYF